MNKNIEANKKGYQARVDGKPITDNYYLKFDRKYIEQAHHWDAGWIEADGHLSKLERESRDN